MRRLRKRFLLHLAFVCGVAYRFAAIKGPNAFRIGGLGFPTLYGHSSIKQRFVRVYEDVRNYRWLIKALGL